MTVSFAHHRFRHLSVACLTLATAIAGCSQSSSGTDALCNAKGKFKTSVKSLRDVDVVKDGTAALRTAAEQVRADGEAFMKEAKSNYGTEVNDLQASLSKLGATLKQVKADGIEPIANAAVGVQTSASALIEKVEASNCS